MRLKAVRFEAFFVSLVSVEVERYDILEIYNGPILTNVPHHRIGLVPVYIDHGRIGQEFGYGADHGGLPKVEVNNITHSGPNLLLNIINHLNTFIIAYIQKRSNSGFTRPPPQLFLNQGLLLFTDFSHVNPSFLSTGH